MIVEYYDRVLEPKLEGKNEISKEREQLFTLKQTAAFSPGKRVYLGTIKNCNLDSLMAGEPGQVRRPKKRNVLYYYYYLILRGGYSVQRVSESGREEGRNMDGRHRVAASRTRPAGTDPGLRPRAAL